MKSLRLFQQHAVPQQQQIFPICCATLFNATCSFSAADLRRRTAPSTTSTFYDRLGVHRSATQDEIKKQYRVKALETHPDLASGSKDKTKAATEFRLVAEAYETLSVPDRRATYDVKIFGVSSSSSKATNSSEPKTRARSSSAEPKKQRTPPRTGFAPRSSTLKEQQGKKPFTSQFVTKDAQRIFREVFGGQSVHDVLFSQEFKRKHGKVAPGTASPTAASASSSAAAAAGASTKEDKEWQQAFKQAQDEVFERFREKHPYANPRNVRLGVTRGAGYQPAPAPGTAFPFRPCASLKFPEGVSAGKEVQPTAGVVPDFSADDVVSVSGPPTSSYGDDQTSFRGDKDMQADDPEAYAEKLRRYGKRSYNEGQMYSYRRPY